MAALAVFGLGVEFWARVDDYVTYGAPILGVYNNDGLYTSDSLGRVGKPNARYRKWGLNEYGMRGPAVVAGRTTILCFGASETFGLYESEGQEYPRQLERRLNELAHRDEFQVVNAAYPGESAYTANVRAAQLVAEVHPRVALIYPTPADYIWLPYLDASIKAPSAPPRGPRFELRIGDRIRTLLKSAIPWSIQTKLREREIRQSAAEFPVMDTLPDENVKRFRSDVAGLVATLRSLGVVPVIVTHASTFGSSEAGADRTMLTAWRKFYPMLKEDGFINMEQRMNAALRALAAEQHVPLIDVASQLPSGPNQFADFVHFTNEGADAMSRTLATGLLPLLRSDEK
jgi:lysophospholipase L1-like esterase